MTPPTQEFRSLYQAGMHQARGMVKPAPVSPREVIRRALEVQATAVMLVHDHPSGDPAPGAKLGMTAQIQRAAAVVPIQVADHVLAGNGKWLS